MEASDDSIGSTSKQIESTGIEFLLIPIPLKMTLYPEFFPEADQVRPKPHGFSLFMTKIREAGVPVVDILGTLEAKKSDRFPLFYKTDMHWNLWGSYQAAQAIAQKAAELTGTSFSWKEDVAFTERVFEGGGESVDMGLLRPLTEEVAFISRPPQDCGPHRSDNPPFPYTAVFEAKKGCPSTQLPPFFMVGNSYMLHHLDNGLMNHFSRFVMLHDLRYFPEMYKRIPRGTKIVAWQFFETQLGYQMQEPKWWEQLDKDFELVSFEDLLK